MLFLILTALLLVVLGYFWKKNQNLPPGPWGLPVVGFLPFLSAKEPHVTLTNLAKKYGPVYGLSLGSVYTVVITDPKLLKTVFSKDVTTGRAPLYLTHGIMKGCGIICAEGEIWKDQRKFVFNTLRQFGGSKIGNQRQKMEALILAQTMDLINFIQEKGQSVTLDPLDLLAHSIGSIITTIIIGKTWERDDEVWKWLHHMQEEGVKHMGIAGPLNFLPFLGRLPHFKKLMDYIVSGQTEQHKLFQKVIDEEQTNLQNCLEKSQEFPEPSNVVGAFLIEREKRKNTPEKELFYNYNQCRFLLADLFGAGLDTTLTTLRWYFLYISGNKTIQKEVQNELKEVLSGRPFSMEDLAALPLLESSVLEVQRIRSVVPVGIPHGSITELTINGYRIPKGTMLVPLQWAIHMDENTWKNPEVFDPHRFLNDEGKIIKSDCFIPFQTGKRMCVGDEFARMILFYYAACFLQNFDMDLVDANEDSFAGNCGITLTPNQYQITFTKL